MKKLILVSAISAVFASQAHAAIDPDVVTVGVFHKVTQSSDKGQMQAYTTKQTSVEQRVFATQYNAGQVIRDITRQQCIDAGNTGEQWCLPVRDKVVEMDTSYVMSARSGERMTERQIQLQSELMNMQRFKIPRHGLSEQEILKSLYDAGLYEYAEIIGETRSHGFGVNHATSANSTSSARPGYESYESDLFSDDHWNHEQQGRYLFSVGASPDASGIASVMAREDEGSQNRYPVFVLDGGFSETSEVNYVNTRNFISYGPTSWREQGSLNVSPGAEWGGYDGCIGHGLAVSHVMAGERNHGVVAGVAKNADIHALRVLACGIGGGDYIDALLWLSGNSHYDNVTPDSWTTDPLWEPSQDDVYTGPPGVINMSFGGEVTFYENGEIVEHGPPQCSRLAQVVVDVLVEKGFTLVSSAGNENIDSWNDSPSSCNGVISVGSISNQGTKSGFSSWGKGLDVFAPGNLISTQTGIEALNNIKTSSENGTSMSAPIVAGLIAETQRHFNVTGMDALALLRFTAFDPSLNGSKIIIAEDGYLVDEIACETGVCGAGRIDGEAFFQAAKAFSEGRLHRISSALSGMSDSELAWYEEHFNASGKAQGTYKLEFFDGNGQAHHYFKLAESFKGDDFKGNDYQVVGEFRSGVEYTNAVNPSSSSYAFQVCTDDEGCSGDWHVISDLASEESQNTRILSSLTTETNSSLDL